jgi:hypothetical protein
VFDVVGVIGGTCPHGIPLRLSLDMRTSEQFCYYLKQVWRHVNKDGGRGGCSCRGGVAACVHLISHSLLSPLHSSPSLFMPQIHLLLTSRPDLKYVYIDFGCRLGKTWERFVANNGAGWHRMVAQAARQLQITVNWMHGSSHQLRCQLKHSARYRDRAGRRVGEHTEQLWSMLKVRMHPCMH